MMKTRHPGLIGWLGFALLAPVPVLGFARGTGQWQVAQSSDPLMHSKSVSVSLTADPSQSSTGGFGKPITLTLLCAGNATEVDLDWHTFLWNGDDSDLPKVLVGYRIGNGKLHWRRWGLATEHYETTYLDDGAASIHFIKQLMKADEFVATVIPPHDDQKEAVFKLAGLATAIKPLRKTCHW